MTQKDLAIKAMFIKLENEMKAKNKRNKHIIWTSEVPREHHTHKRSLRGYWNIGNGKDLWTVQMGKARAF